MTLTTKYRPKVVVIIPVFDDYDRLEICLEHLWAQRNPPEFEVVVVDNGTPDDRMVDLNGRNPRLKHLHEERPGSYAARNKAIQASRAGILAFTDADCLPARDWLARGVEALETLGPGLIVGRIDLFVREPNQVTAAEAWELRKGFPQEKYAREMTFGATANVLTHREVIERVGPFDASLQSGGDREFGERVAAAGYPIAYSSDVIVRHPARHSLSALLKKTRRTTKGDVHRMKMRGEWTRLWRATRALEAGAYLATPIPAVVWHFISSQGVPTVRAKYAAAETLVRHVKEWEMLKLLLKPDP